MNILPPHTYRISYFYFQHFMPANSFRSLFSSLDSALQALQASEQHVNELVPGDNRETSLSEGSFIEYYTYLGSAYLSLNSHDAAERTLHTALERCRRISQVSCEAQILIELSKLRTDTGAWNEAQRLAEEALVITEAPAATSSKVQELSFNSQSSRSFEMTQSLAKEHAQKAKKLATCDGPPKYTYKAA